jgi:hypothetical protein
MMRYDDWARTQSSEREVNGSITRHSAFPSKEIANNSVTFLSQRNRINSGRPGHIKNLWNLFWSKNLNYQKNKIVKFYVTI